MTVEGVEEQGRDSRGDGGCKTNVAHTGKVKEEQRSCREKAKAGLKRESNKNREAKA